MIKRILPYKDLFIIFILREVMIRYRHSLLGILWAVIQPLAMMALFTFVFTYVVKIGLSGDSPKPVFFYSALVPWTFFATSLNQCIPSLSNHQNLITKIYFPREIIPLSRIASAMIDFFIAAILLIPFLLFYKISPTVHTFWVIPLFAILLLFTVSVSLLLSSLNVYYRDVQLASRFLIQLWFFASPILYSIDTVSIKLKIFLFLNPMTFIIENMRRCLIEGRGVVPWQFAFVTLLTIAFYLLAYRFFIKTEKAFSDVI